MNADPANLCECGASTEDLGVFQKDGPFELVVRRRCPACGREDELPLVDTEFEYEPIPDGESGATPSMGE